MVVSEVMTPNPATADAGSSIRAVLRQLVEMDVRHLPIVDDGVLVGIISDRDLKEVTSRMVAEGETRIDRVLDRPISDLMSSDVLSVDPETELEEVVDLMIEH